MTYLTQQASKHGYHSYADTLVAKGFRLFEEEQTKYVLSLERDLRYRFYLHQHPYVQELIRRLLRKGTAGLQAADTIYLPDGSSLPGSVEVALEPGAALRVSSGARISPLSTLNATAGGVPIQISANLGLRIGGSAPVQATFANRTRATLMAGLTPTPSEGAQFNLPANAQSNVFGDAEITLTGATPVVLHDGSTATLSAGARVLLGAGMPFTLTGTPLVTLLASRRRPELFADFFGTAYQPDQFLVQRPHPVKDLDFTSSGAYSVYNWELFFHVPLTIGIHLSKNQRFAEAQHWFHYLFDPTDDSDGPTPERFWKVRPFQSTDVRQIEEILVNLATGADEALRTETIRSIEAWKNAPFRPHVIARYRQQAYMYKTVMAYLDNLIAWGDSLFRQDTGEAIDEALQLYVLAANILGPRPQPTPRKGTVRPQTYANLRQDLQQFGTVLEEVEADLPFDLMPFPADEGDATAQFATLQSLGKALYFCVPRNDRLLSYWDTVADRLFKIRNSLNIQGVFRQLALFEPPIDPALLARAAAAGLDIGAIVNGLNQPLPLVRFRLLVQKAEEICQEVKSLGAGLLAAMEKEDGEALTALRARHERVILELVEQVRYGQLQEATKSKESLVRSLALAVQRYVYYERLLGRPASEIADSIPELTALDKAGLEKMKFRAEEPEVGLREIEVDIATDAFAQAAQILYGGKLMSSHEVRESLLLEAAQLSSDVASILNVASSIAAVVPQFEVSAEPWGMGGATNFGGQNIASGISAGAAAARGIADRLSFEARRANRIDMFDRRERDWAFQSNLAAGEISQIFKQLRAAEIREAIAEMELKSHRQQVKQAREIEHFLNEEGTEKQGKKTNRALYAWMKREVKGLYAQCFQFAFDVARRAERALQHELGDPSLSYVQFGYLAGREGLLAGERLGLDVKRMDMAHHELNRREYELTKHVSLLQVDPMALLRLRATGRCTVRLPEALFDLDGPGHYFRRIRSVALSIPSVTGPYASVSCKLTLLNSSIRKSPLLRDDAYERQDAEDDRFSDFRGSLQSVVTSSAQNDSGLFDGDARDERYLPFENSGVISEWQLELPANPSQGDPQQFDYNTISDVVLHIRYTAREGGGLLRSRAVVRTRELIEAAETVGSVRLFSVRYEFPTEWARFQSHTPEDDHRFELRLELRPEHYPFWSRGRLETVERVQVVARSAKAAVPPQLEVFDAATDTPAAAAKDALDRRPAEGNLLVGELDQIALPASPVGEVRISFEDRELSDLWIAITWGK